MDPRLEVAQCLHELKKTVTEMEQLSLRLAAIVNKLNNLGIIKISTKLRHLSVVKDDKKP